MRVIVRWIDKIQPGQPHQAVVATVQFMIEDVGQVEPLDPWFISTPLWHIVPQDMHGRYFAQLVFLVKFGYRKAVRR